MNLHGLISNRITHRRKNYFKFLLEEENKWRGIYHVLKITHYFDAIQKFKLIHTHTFSERIYTLCSKAHFSFRRSFQSVYPFILLRLNRKLGF